MYILDQVVLSLRPGYSHFWARLFNIISRLYCSACQTTRCQGSKRESAATPLPMHLGWGGASSWSNRPTRPEVPYITTYLRESFVRPWRISTYVYITQHDEKQFRPQTTCSLPFHFDPPPASAGQYAGLQKVQSTAQHCTAHVRT